MSTAHVLLFAAIIVVPLFAREIARGVVKVARGRPASLAQRGVRLCQSRRAPRFFEEWSHTIAQRLLAGGSVRWK